MAEFKIAAIIKFYQNEWVKLFVQNGSILDGRIQDGRIQDGCHLQVNQIELVWFRVRVEWECFWVNLREDNKVSESKMAVSQSNMTEFKMAAIINLSQNEWVKFFCANGGNQSWQVWVSLRGHPMMAESKIAKFKIAEFKMAAIINLSQNEWVKLSSAKCLNPRWPNSRWLPSSGWVRMNEFESDWISLGQSFVQNGCIQNFKIEDGCHHQVNQIELVWFRVRVEWECFWVNLREDNKVSESKMAVSESNMAEFKMAAIIKLSQNEWVKFFCGKLLNPTWQNSRWLPSSCWVKMNEFKSDWISLRQSFV